MLQGVEGFTALNQADKNGLQNVLVVVKGASEPVGAFSVFAQTERPIGGEISEASIGEFEGFGECREFERSRTINRIPFELPL